MQQLVTKTQNLIEKYRGNNARGVYDKEYLRKEFQKECAELKVETIQAVKDKIIKFSDEMRKLKEKSNEIVPRKPTIEELLDRQELTLKVELMPTATLKEYAAETLRAPHSEYTELFLEKALRDKGLGEYMDALLMERDFQAESDSRYKTLKAEKEALELELGFGGEFATTRSNGQVALISGDEVAKLAGF